MSSLSGVLAALVAVTAGLLFAPNGDIVQIGSFPAAGPERVEGNEHRKDGVVRRDVFFATEGGLRCHGWFYRPAGTPATTKLPVVLMASGMGAQIDFGMAPYAEEFAKRGFAALLFDYRGFGSSGGVVRNLVNPTLHLQDWRAAVRFLADESGGLGTEVDVGRLGLWGSSMSGGHVLVLAAELLDKTSDAFPASVQLRGVVSQSPHLDGRENRKNNIKPPPHGRGLLGAARISRTALSDLARAALGLPPAYIPIVGEAGSVSLMPLEAAELQNYYRKHPTPEEKGGGWQNMAPARLALLIGGYSPIDSVDKVAVPTLFIAAEQDALCPSALITKASQQCGGDSELLLLEGGHFELYFEKNYARATTAMVNHFTKTLK